MAKKRPRKTRPPAIARPGQPPAPVPAADRLLGDVRGLIEQARAQVARTVNSAMVALYWQIGKRIREDIPHEKRAGYGEEIVQTLSAQLTREYGRGSGRRNLFYMVQFDLVFRDPYFLDFLGLTDGYSEKDIRLARERLARQAQDRENPPGLPGPEMPARGRRRGPGTTDN